MKWAWFGLGVGAVLALAFVGVLIAGEMRYRNCVLKVEARYPVAYQQALQGAENRYGLDEPEYRRGEFIFYSEPDRTTALDRCEPSP